MSSDGEVNWWEPVAGITIWVVILLVANELYNRYLAPIVWVRSGDTDLALRVVEIVAILLPLLAIFFQILFRRADDDESPLHDRAEDLLPSLLLTFVGLFTAGLASTTVVLLGGVGVVVGLGLAGLLVALVGLLIVVVTFANAVGDEYDIRTEQQELGNSATDTEQHPESGDSE